MLDALAKGERSAVHARAMAQAVYADAAPAQVLAARLLWRHAQPCDDGIRLAGLLAQLGSSHAKRLLAEMSTGGWDAEAAAAMVDDVLDSAPRTLGLAARVLARPDQWGHALTLADELTQQQRDGHARGDARGKIPTYAGTARRTTRQNR